MLTKIFNINIILVHQSQILIYTYKSPGRPKQLRQIKSIKDNPKTHTSTKNTHTNVLTSGSLYLHCKTFNTHHSWHIQKNRNTNKIPLKSWLQSFCGSVGNYFPL